jgi:hypothetical protein
MKYLTLYQNNKVETIMEIDDDSVVLTQKQFFVKNTYEECILEAERLGLTYLYKNNDDDDLELSE